mgnify:CR=1 FL=1
MHKTGGVEKRVYYVAVIYPDMASVDLAKRFDLDEAREVVDAYVTPLGCAVTIECCEYIQYPNGDCSKGVYTNVYEGGNMDTLIEWRGEDSTV